MFNNPLTKLTERTQELMTQTGVPGVAVGVRHQGTEYVATLGITNRNHPLPVDENTLFQIGSISKTMTATVAMRLVEQGRLDLDAPVRRYLPDFRLQDEAAAANASVRHLFTHTGGWLGDYFADTGKGDDALARYVANMVQLPQLAPLGTVWSYNNAAFSLAGRVIEVVAGQPFEQVMQELLFVPLGMNMSFYFTGDIMTQRFVAGHIMADFTSREHKSDYDIEVATPWPLARSAHAAGGVIATVRDMLRYARLHLDRGTAADGARLLGADSIAAMQSQQSTAADYAEVMGISWMLGKTDWVRTISHGGATNGQIAQLVLAPDHDFALVILTNANRGRELTRDLSNWALQSFLGAMATPPTLRTLTPEALQPYLGYYTARLTDVEVTAGDGGLVLQSIPKGGFPDKDSPAGPTPPPAPSVFFEEDRFIITDGPSKEGRGEFIRDQHGTIRWVRVGGRIHERTKRQG
ncbi:MAG: serine hydrolase domain-containing protein [Caldilineaceae bacterium]